ncbi:MAG: bifunctional [glutamate--ammonia ligase]-adenylyl-L-tyrosine phosphorylase/[glutamate--ammonia-ligase] adenylyltransferase [Deltaproteobacteria bacterium]|nr:bifunctional [glutamate--ammonia ligase]-adenylyl-L-tyrosine phosphorylase/[glutamate--ammonia-ligase] adenylyltransferase [Deltaproteobacteria bacterium]
MDGLEAIAGLPESLRERIERLIRESPSPTLAECNLPRLIEASEVDSIQKIPDEYLSPLFRLLGGSAFLSDILVRQGSGWPDVFLTAVKTSQKTFDEHLSDLAPLSTQETSDHELAGGLRRHKQLEMLRIGTRDLSSLAPPVETMRELTALAEASLHTAYRCCRAHLERDFGNLKVPDKETANGFAILGMGKLGGGELNFSSDIDLIYFYEQDQGESKGGPKGKIRPRDFFTRLAERITQLMGDITEDGFVFRTDLRLRPLGRNGPLVQSLDSTLLYYESWGQSWERAALIKARPVAGDRELGYRFLKAVEPFVYRRYLDYTTVEDLREMKLRIEQELVTPGGKERDLKQGTGGIREVEFFTQALQLVNGGYESELRGSNTLRALERLAQHRFIPADEKTLLSEAYIFLRNVEHKVQMVREAHSFLIPRDEEEERFLARRLNVVPEPGGDERSRFWKDYHRHTASVRQIFERLFYSAQKEMEPEKSSSFGKLWNNLDHEESALEQLKQIGFSDTQRTYRTLLEIRDGTPYSPPSPRRLKIMTVLGPALISEVLRWESPDRTLFNLAEFSHRVGGRTGFLSLLAENPGTMRLLISLFANSQFLTDIFLKRAELLDSLIRVDLSRLRKTKDEMFKDLMSHLEPEEDLEDKLNALRRYRAEEFIRIGLHDIGGELELEEVIEQLSDLADVSVQGAVKLACDEVEERYGTISGGAFVVIGMGKLGGREINYHSDLDLIFIYDAPREARSEGGTSEGIVPHEYYMRIGQKLMTFLTATMQEGIVYKIDMRLRPSGNAGPLVTSLEAFCDYHQTSGELWERQALIKARFVAGDTNLGLNAERAASATAHGEGLPEEGIEKINHLRMRMERELAGESDSQFNLKKGKGGMVDVEFITQMLLLKWGHLHPTIRQGSTLKALRELHDQKILNEVDYALLSDGYRFLRQIDHRLRLKHDQSIDLLEREPGKLQGIAKAMGYRGEGNNREGELLLAEYEKRRNEIRSCYDRYFNTTFEVEK